MCIKQNPNYVQTESVATIRSVTAKCFAIDNMLADKIKAECEHGFLGALKALSLMKELLHCQDESDF